MKKFLKHAINQVLRKDQLHALNDTERARLSAMGSHSDQHSKEVYRDRIENQRRLRAERQTFNKKK